MISVLLIVLLKKRTFSALIEGFPFHVIKANKNCGFSVFLKIVCVTHQLHTKTY